MAVVTAFKTLPNTIHAGLTVYFRATGCTALTIADVLPLLSKITAYEDEYVIGEMKIWDTGSESAEPNNCAMVRVMVYNDGWICAWFDEETQNQQASSTCGFIDAQTLDNLGAIIIEYLDKYNGCLLKVISSSPTDPERPDDTVFCIRETDYINGRIKVHEDTSSNTYHFNTGHTYATEVYMTNGNLVWWGHDSNSNALPSNLSNRLYRAIYEMWEGLRYSSNTTVVINTAITKAFLDDGGVFTDYTTAFNNTGSNDVPLMPTTEVMNDAFYFGSENKFNGLTLDIDQAGIGNTIAWEYWDGSAWSSLIVTDDTIGFTVLTNHIHKVDDTTNPVTSVDATNQATVNTLLNEIKSDYNAHRVSTTFHDAADSTNVIASADATNLATSITLANEIKTDYNLHRSESGIHPYNDDENTATSADGVDLSTTIILVNEIKGDYNAHLVATKAANTVTFTPSDSWVKCFVNSSQQYWIRSRISVAAYTTQPLLTQGWVIVPDSLLYTNSNLGMYSFEDTSALYCLICGVGTYAQNSNDDTYFYNTSMLGKTIYSHSILCGGWMNTIGAAYGFIHFNGVLYANIGNLSGYRTNGYQIFNIEDIDHPVGVQNSFRCYAVSVDSGYYVYMTLASVLITS